MTESDATETDKDKEIASLKEKNINLALKLVEILSMSKELPATLTKYLGVE